MMDRQGCESLKEFLPGLRIIKTTVALLICLLTFYAFKYYNPIYAAIACVLMMRSTVEESFQSGLQRIIGTIFGGIVSLALLNLLDFFKVPNESLLTPIVITLGVLFVLIVSKASHANSYVGSMAAIVLLIIMISNNASNDDNVMYIIVRVLETIYGVVIAVLVNRYLNFNLDKKKLRE